MTEPDHAFKIEYDENSDQFVARLYGYFENEMGWSSVLLSGHCVEILRRLLGEFRDMRERNPTMSPREALDHVLARWWEAIPKEQRGSGGF